MDSNLCLNDTQRRFILQLLQATHFELLGKDRCLITDHGHGATLTKDNSWTLFLEDHMRALDLAAHLLGGRADAATTLAEAQSAGAPDPMALEPQMRAELTAQGRQDLLRRLNAWEQAVARCNALRAQDEAGTYQNQPSAPAHQDPAAADHRDVLRQVIRRHS